MFVKPQLDLLPHSFKHLQETDAIMNCIIISILIVFLSILAYPFAGITCTSEGVNEISVRCCDTTCECRHCNTDLMCNTILSQPSNESTCCGGPCCPEWCHHQCTRLHFLTPLELLLVRSHESAMETRFIKDGSMMRVEEYGCDLYCCDPVSQQQCNFTCGTCTTLQVRARNGLQHGQFNISCGKDDVSCVQRTRQMFQEGVRWPCWRPDFINGYMGLFVFYA